VDLFVGLFIYWCIDVHVHRTLKLWIDLDGILRISSSWGNGQCLLISSMPPNGKGSPRVNHPPLHTDMSLKLDKHNFA